MSDSEETSTHRIPDFIENSPLLRQLFYDRRFRAGAIILCLLMGGIGLSIPRLFVVSPPGATPVIRVSLIGKLQARSLARTATKQAAAEHWEESIWSWRSALQQNAGDIEANRGLITTLASIPDPRLKYSDFAARQSAWLLRLTGTNDTDLELVVRMFRHYQADDYIVALLATRVESLPPVLVAELAKANFRFGNISQFGDLRQRVGSGLPADNDWPLYDAAWRWGWGPVEGVSNARDEIERAEKDPQHSTLALHLHMQVAFARGEVSGFEMAFTQLKELKTDRPLDHANYWELLALNGRKNDAVAIAKAYGGELQNAPELLLIAREYEAIGLGTEAAELLQKHRLEFTSSSDLWARIADLYIKGSEWAKLRELAIDLRADSVQSVEMPGFGWYLEGVANLKTGAVDDARRKFAKAAEAPIRPVVIAYGTASSMAKLGYPESSAKIYSRLEQWFGKSDEYWFALALSGYQSGDFELFLAASRRAYQLSPKKLAIINNLAAALLLLREQPAEAVRLTVECIAANPNNAGFRINHALALILNNQGAEADKVLRKIDTEHLTMEEKSLYHYARFQVEYSAGATAICRDELKFIELRHLKAEQSKWMHVAMVKIGAARDTN